MFRKSNRGRFCWLLSSTAIVGSALCTPAVAQTDPTVEVIEGDVTAERPTAVSYGAQTVSRYRFGAKVTAAGGTVRDILAMVAVPLAGPEQEVELIEEDLSPHIESVEYRDTDAGVRQMLITIPTLSPRQQAHAYAVFEVRTRVILPPQETKTLVAPEKPERDRELKRYIGRSPFIDANHTKIRAAVKAALKDVEATPEGGTGVWERVEALYDYAMDHVKYKEGEDKSSVQALASGEGDCQSIGAVFVAMCRTEKIPARMVWVDGHQYAEFYLVDAEGQGGWYPIETAGSRAFGEMPLARVILQKGDNFRVPERRGERLRYASDFALLMSTKGTQPKIVYVREHVQ
jgi:transglutaminase-like putative cysteine protease